MRAVESFLPVFQGTYGTIFEDIDFEQKDEVGRSMVDTINKYICELGIQAEFQDFVSPKFYNFSNDSVNVVYTTESLDTLIKWIEDNVTEVANELKNRYTSRDGFISHHSTDVEEWIDDLYTDSHKLGAVLDIYFSIEHDVDHVELEMYQDLSENGLIIYEND
jgi:secreted Zn-dependent insulinase-like peptidase